MAIGQLSLYGAAAMLGSTFGASVAIPSNFYLALLTAQANPSMNGSEIPELSGGGYGRQVIPNTSTYWSSTTVAMNTYVMNTKTHQWPTSPQVGATADWQTAVGWALCDAISGGNVWAVGALATQVVIPAGFCAVMTPGSLYFELSPFFSTTSAS